MSIRYNPIGLTWQSFVLGESGLLRAAEGNVVRRLSRILNEWEGTPYNPGQCKAGIGTYCTAFVVAVLDALYRSEPTPLPIIPNDAGMHDPDRARAGLRWFLEQYPRHEKIPSGNVQPGDILVTGPKGGGPGHAIIVGPRENTLWQCSGKTGVHFTGMALPDQYLLHCVYRMTDRERWL